MSGDDGGITADCKSVTLETLQVRFLPHSLQSLRRSANKTCCRFFFVLPPFFSAARISRYSLNGKTADLYPVVIRSTRIAGFATIQMTGTSDAVAFVYLPSAEKASGFHIMRLLDVTKTYPCGNENGTGVRRWISRVKYMATFMLGTPS